MLGGWGSYVVVDEVNDVNDMCKGMYVMIDFSCVGKC
jgi:hypothetical protein